MKWKDIGLNGRRAAQTLKDQHPRSSVSRAYYAAFCVLNERLIPHETPPRGFETHAHRELPRLIERYLLQADTRRRRSLRTTMRRLYDARLDADYHRSRTIDRSVAINALRDVKAVFEILGVPDV